MHVYENHLGGVYLTKDYEEPEICEQCGDSDDYLFSFDTPQRLLEELGYEDLSNEFVIDILKDIANYEDNKPYIKAFIKQKEEEIAEIKEVFEEIL